MAQKNLDIRLKLRARNRYLYELASELSVSEQTIIRWLRQDLTPEKKAAIDAAVAKLCNEESERKEAYDQQIRAPFERDLDVITAFRWDYCGKSGAELTPETYAEFEAANIHIEWLSYPARLNHKQLKSS